MAKKRRPQDADGRTKVDQITDRVKRHPVLAWVVLIALVFAGLDPVLNVFEKVRVALAGKASFDIPAVQVFYEPQAQNLWGVYKLGTRQGGFRRTPIHVAAYLILVNQQSVSASIASIQVEELSANGQWTRLKHVPIGLYTLYNLYMDTSVRIGGPTPFLDRLLPGKVMAARSPVSGWIFLQHPRGFQTTPEQRLRVSVTDFGGSAATAIELNGKPRANAILARTGELFDLDEIPIELVP